MFVVMHWVDLAVDIEMSDDTFYVRMPGGDIRSVSTNGPSTNFQ